VRALLKRFDIYVCSSLAESSPVSVWEAMAMARPVVSTDVGDVPRHVEDGKAGYIVGVGDHEAMAERLALLCADPDMRRRQGETARRIALAEFTPDVIGRETLEFYRLIRHDTA
jgi:glycosyltransferase involved in cell wall biosynthesis